MPQYLIIIIAAITFLKDSFKGINKKWLYGIGVGIMLYFLWRRFQTSQAETLLNEAGENVLVKICTDIKDAINPWGDLLGFSIGSIDGTDEEKIKTAALALKVSGKTFQQLAETWEKIYKTNLTTELNKEGVKDLFLQTIATGSTGGGSTGSNGGTSTGSTGGSSGVVYVKKEDIIALKAGYNIRDGYFENTISKVSKGDEKFIVKEIWLNKTIAGTKGTWLYITNTEWYVPTRYWVILSAVKNVIKK